MTYINGYRLGFAIRWLLVIGLLFWAAQTATSNSPDDGASPTVSAHLRTGYGLSPIALHGYVPVRYQGRLWYAAVSDFQR